MIKRVLPLLFILSNISVLYASIEKYTISVCITSSLENALTCKYKVLAENVKLDVFIVKENEKYLTNFGIFIDENSAKYAIKIAPSYVKKQKPFVKKISNEVVALKSKNEQVIDLSLPIKEIVMNNETAKNKTKKDEKLIDLTSTTPKAEELKLVQSYPFDEGQKLNGEPVKKWKKPVVYTKEELEYIEELKKISMEEFDKADEEKQQKIVPAKINKPKEIVQEVKPETVEKLVDNIEKVQRVYNYEKVEKVEDVALILLLPLFFNCLVPCFQETGTVIAGPLEVVINEFRILKFHSFFRRVCFRIGEKLVGIIMLSDFLRFLGKSPVDKFLCRFHIRCILNNRYGTQFISGTFFRQRQADIRISFLNQADSVMKIGDADSCFAKSRAACRSRARLGILLDLLIQFGKILHAFFLTHALDDSGNYYITGRSGARIPHDNLAGKFRLQQIIP